jgi:hypothetical protein
MCAKYDTYRDGPQYLPWGALFTMVAVLLVTFFVVYFENRAAEPVAKLPEYKIEPQTTITARP